MLTDNQQAIINSITQEFLTFNEQRKVASKPYSFFDTSVLDAENEYAQEQLQEAAIINRSVVRQLTEMVKSDYALIKKDFEKIDTRLSAWEDVDKWNGLPKYENETTIATISIGDDLNRLVIDYEADGKRFTAANGTSYVVLNGDYRVRNCDSRLGNVVAPTLADLFAKEKFVQKVTRLYRDQTKIN